jgi:hypothetical protein
MCQHAIRQGLTPAVFFVVTQTFREIVAHLAPGTWKAIEEPRIREQGTALRLLGIPQI